MLTIRNHVDGKRHYIRLHILDHAVDSLEGSSGVVLVEHTRQKMLHTVFQVQHAVLTRS